MLNDSNNMSLQGFRKKHEDYLVANLLDFFRKPEHEDKWPNAVKMVSSFLKRSLNIESPRLDKRFYFLAAQLKNNLTPTTLRLFAGECLQSAANFQSHQHKREPIEKKPYVNLQKAAMRDIKRALENGHSEEAALFRAANSLLKAKKAAEQRLLESARLKKHPLSETLELLHDGSRALPREDIRNHLLHLKSHVNRSAPGEGMLFNILKKAQSFSVVNMHQLLGDELFFLCRPLGFADKNEQIIEVEVPSSAHLNALTYRKFEILKALKQDAHFKKAQNIRLKVRSRF